MIQSISPPRNITQLDERLDQAASHLSIPIARARVMLCTLIVSQLLPDAVVVKGGMGIKMRLGELGTRATSDLDVSAHPRDTQFRELFENKLAEGWGTVPPSRSALKKNPDALGRVAFTATLKAEEPHDPGLDRPEYIMHPYRVTIKFLGRAWGALDIEVSDPEIAMPKHERHEIDTELVQFSDYFGFGPLQSVELIELAKIVKLCGVTRP